MFLIALLKLNLLIIVLEYIENMEWTVAGRQMHANCGQAGGFDAGEKEN